MLFCRFVFLLQTRESPAKRKKTFLCSKARRDVEIASKYLKNKKTMVRVFRSLSLPSFTASIYSEKSLNCLMFRFSSFFLFALSSSTFLLRTLQNYCHCPFLVFSSSSHRVAVAMIKARNPR